MTQQDTYSTEINIMHNLLLLRLTKMPLSAVIWLFLFDVAELLNEYIAASTTSVTTDCKLL